MNETSGGNVGYYTLDIQHPKRFDPCTVECEDVIAALGLNFFEGEAFKAIWRKGAQRTFGVGKAGNTALRDAEKMAHYGARELAHEQQRAKVGVRPGTVAETPWTMHDGLVPNIAVGELIEIKHRDGTFSGPSKATPDGDYWSWSVLGARCTPRDIVQYRRVGP